MNPVNQLSSIKLRDLVSRSESAQGNQVISGEKAHNFGDTISGFLEAVNDQQKTAAGGVTDVIEGKSDNLHETMIQLEEASLSFQLMLEIRNKLLESYKEIERISI
ncbi:MAG TPA: flagellar hook-basal body complex protein FliE [Calditrichia bacterium]|nr:flagellar hook-basal body complex protein FliE [Calditrichota bacterium]HQU72484.1 flagellar hook-basal body complex protein FliE [Calditrichia bacterium]HQV32995.1 flagellar hook-basal body complex protein FliE [Calditrichia bacterium]